MIELAREEYEKVRGACSWEKDHAALEWQDEAYEYLTETEVRLRSRMLAESYNPNLEKELIGEFRSDSSVSPVSDVGCS